MKISVQGVVWYRRQHYARVLEVMEDAHLLPPTFDKWLHRAEQAIEQARHRGLVPVKAYIDPDEFVVWCRARSLNVNGEARSQFAAAVARAHHVEGHG